MVFPGLDHAIIQDEPAFGGRVWGCPPAQRARRVPGRPQMDHRVVTLVLGLTRAVDRGPKIRLRSGPVGQAIHRAPVADDDGRPATLEPQPFHFALDREDRPLGGFSACQGSESWKSALEEDARSVGEDHHVAAKAPSENVQNRRPAGPGTSCHGNQATWMPFATAGTGHFRTREQDRPGLHRSHSTGTLSLNRVRPSAVRETSAEPPMSFSVCATLKRPTGDWSGLV